MQNNTGSSTITNNQQLIYDKLKKIEEKIDLLIPKVDYVDILEKKKGK